MPWIEANGASLRYVLSGTGSQTLVLMHEAGGCLESYDEATPGFERDFRVLRYDQRGFGFSEKVRELTFDTVVEDLRGILDALKISAPIYLAGCAMGADYAVGFAAKYPSRVSKLAIASPNIDHNGPRSAGSIERAQVAEREGIRSVMNASHDHSYPEILRAPDRARFARYQARWVCNTPASFTAQAKLMSTVDLTPEYAKITANTMVIGATHDAGRPPAKAERVAKALKSSKYVLADTGHFFALQTPQLFVDTLLPFFKNG